MWLLKVVLVAGGFFLGLLMSPLVAVIVGLGLVWLGSSPEAED
jgi:hypothetical protein